MYMFSVIWVFCGQSDDLEDSIWVILAEEFATNINVVSTPQVDVYRNEVLFGNQSGFKSACVLFQRIRETQAGSTCGVKLMCSTRTAFQHAGSS